MKSILRIVIYFVLGFAIFNFIEAIIESVILYFNGFSVSFLDKFINAINSNLIVYGILFVILYLGILLYDIVIVKKLNSSLNNYKKCIKEVTKDE